jgi:ketosteroid isomerase-like protein
MMAFSALWRAYSEGRLERSLDLVDPECELVALEGDRTYAGHDGVRAWLDDVRRTWKTLLISYDTVEEPYEGWVIATGRITASSQDGRVLESPLVCVAAFRDDRLVRGRAFRERDDADRWAAALHG